MQESQRRKVITFIDTSIGAESKVSLKSPKAGSINCRSLLMDSLTIKGRILQVPEFECSIYLGGRYSLLPKQKVGQFAGSIFIPEVTSNKNHG